jgi:hypothetical protein
MCYTSDGANKIDILVEVIIWKRYLLVFALSFHTSEEFIQNNDAFSIPN